LPRSAAGFSHFNGPTTVPALSTRGDRSLSMELRTSHYSERLQRVVNVAAEPFRSRRARAAQEVFYPGIT
jgi:hypothetical protein